MSRSTGVLLRSYGYIQISNVPEYGKGTYKRYIHMSRSRGTVLVLQYIPCAHVPEYGSTSTLVPRQAGYQECKIEKIQYLPESYLYPVRLIASETPPGVNRNYNVLIT